MAYREGGRKQWTTIEHQEIMSAKEDSFPESQQRHRNPQASISNAFAYKTPFLTHLNADTSWLISLPYPGGSSPPPGRARFNILLDAWLNGKQVDVASWFSTQWHAIRSSVQTISELDAALQEAESSSAQDLATSDSNLKRSVTYIDLVVCAHEFTDHCHQATLVQVDPLVPVFATTKAAQLVRSWNHFKTVVEVPTFTQNLDWRKTSLSPLPDWLGIGRLVSGSWDDFIVFHSAVVFFTRTDMSSSTADAIIYTPHGVYPDHFSCFPTAKPPVRALALIHGLHEFSITPGKGINVARLNLGARNAIKAQRILNAKYWVGTHDENKDKAGLIAHCLERRKMVLEDLVDKEVARDGGSSASLTYKDLSSGESLLLE